MGGQANSDSPSELRDLKNESRPRWHKTYYLLAAFYLVVIVFSLFLNYQLKKSYQRSININRQWAARLNHYSNLTSLASEVIASGKNVFDSHSARAETDRLEAATISFYESIEAARNDLASHVPLSERSLLIEDLQEITTSINDVKVQTHLILTSFEKGETAKSREQISTIDNLTAKVKFAFANLNLHTRDIQTARLNQQTYEAQSIERFEYTIFTIVILSLGGVIYYGRKLSAKVRSSEQEHVRFLAALQASEESFRVVTEYSPVGVFQTDATGRFFYSNKRLQELSGYSLEEGAGDGWKRAIHPDDLQRLTDELRASVKEGRDFSHEYRLVTPQGEIRWVHSRCNPLYSESGEITRFIGTTEDITKQKLSEQRLRLQHAVTSALAAATSQEEAVTGILESVCENTGWEVGSVWGVDAHKQTLSCIAIKHTGIDEFADFEDASRKLTFAPGSGLPGRVWASHQPIWIADIAEDNSFPRADLAIKCGLRAAFAFPITIDDEIRGVIEFFSKQVCQLDEAMFDLLNSISSQIGQFLERKRAEEALRNNEEQVRLILDTALDAVVSIDTSGVVTKWNTQAEKMFGWNRKEAIGQNISDLIIPHHHRQSHEQGMKRYIETGKGQVMNRRIEITALRRDGEEFPIELAISPVWSNDDVRFNAFIRDITERKQFEETLKESEERFRTAIVHAPIGMALVALNGHLIQVNRSLCKIVGYSESELLFTDFRSITHPDDLKAEMDYVQKMISGEINTYQMEKRYFHKSGRVVWILLNVSMIRDPSGKPLYFILQTQDISERKEAEEKIRLNETLLRTIIDSTPDWIFIKDRNHRFLLVNQSYAKSFGLEPQQFTGKTDLDIGFPEDVVKGNPAKGIRGFWADDREVIESGETKFIKEEPAVVNGEPVTLSTVKVPLKDAGGWVWGILGFVHDITDRKRAEEALRQSEKDYRGLFENAHDAIVIIRPDDEIILDVNQRACEMYGFSRDQFLGKSMIDVTRDKIQGRKNVENVLGSGGSHSFETVHYKKDGSEMFLEVHASVVNYKGRPAILGMHNDITSRKEAEERLRRSEEKFRALLESASEAIIAIRPDGTITLINKRAEDIFNYNRSELIGQPVSLLVPDRFKQEELLLIGESFTRDDPSILKREMLGLRRNGEEFPMTLNVSLVDTSEGKIALGFIADITSRKEAEERLRRSEERFRALLESASEAILTTNRSGQITLINAKAEQMFGYDRSELIGQQVEALMPEHSRRLHVRHRRDFFANPHTRQMNQFRELSGKRKNGEEFPIEVSLSYVKSGEDMIAMAFISDITDRRRAEVELREAKESAESASRAKSEFLANMSHEIRTPLNAVIGMTGLLLDTNLSVEQEEFAEVIRTSSDSLLTIINDILAFSKIESGRLELEEHPFDLRECIEESLDLLATKASEKNLNLAYTVDAQAPGALKGDSTRLRQILVNLVNNAVKFTEKGEVVVSVSARPLLEDEFSATSNPRHPLSHSSGSLYELHFVVVDTGIGIPREKIDRLFQSFSQVDTSTTRLFGGTGLGLAISKRLAEMMGGTMWVESKLGVGSQFHFTITATAAPSQTRVFLKAIQPELKGRRLLIVDDNPTNRRILSLQAESWGMIPFVADSGQQAMEWISRGDPFDVAILDMQMPEMDGVQLASEIRKLRDSSELPLLMLTSVGKRGREDQDGIFSAFLTKPIKPSQLYDALIAILAGNLPNVMKPSVSKTGLRASGRQSPLKILLVEDNVVNQKVALKILERMGYRADVAGNGLEAIEALERQHYDVALMDVQMPEMDGLAATREICRRWSKGERPRIIAMTANAMQGDREECLAAGMDDYIAKPVQTEDLIAAIERSSLTVTRPDAESHPNETDVIDFSVIETVFETDGKTDSAAITQLVKVYIDDTEQQIIQLEEFIGRGSAHEVRELAHTLKGGSAALGATQMAELSSRLESMAREDSLEGAVNLLDQLKNEFERVRRALEVKELLKAR